MEKEVLITTDVVASIAALAAVEADGVHSTIGSFTNDSRHAWC